jgi:hypothetical protein
MSKTNLQKVTDILQLERWAGQDAQRAFDSRVVEYAVKNSIDPVSAINGPAFHIPAVDFAKIREGINL